MYYLIVKKCVKCRKEKDINEFSFKIKAKGIRHSYCKDCSRLIIKNHYNNNRQYYLEKTNKRNNDLRQKILIYQKQYLLDNPCIDCGEKDITVLEFDHKAKSLKIKAVSALIRARYSLQMIVEEISKCEVRCANCHKRKTARQFKWFKNNNAPVVKRI